VVRRIFSDILLVLGLKKVEKHWYKALSSRLLMNNIEKDVKGSFYGQFRDRVPAEEN
jgi:hypothetical protein